MIFENGKFVKLMFLLFSIFFGFIIIYQMHMGQNMELVMQLITVLTVFFAFVGKSITEVYRDKQGLNDGK